MNNQPPIDSEKIREQLKTAPKIEIKNGPEVEAKVEEWLKQHRGDETKTIKPPEQSKEPELPKDIIEQLGDSVSNQKMMDNVLPPEQNIKITEDEEIMYVKALLNDEPFCLDVDLFKGKVKTRFRTRSIYEQERLWTAIRSDIKDGRIPEGDWQLIFTRMQQYCMSMQLIKFGDTIIEHVELVTGSSLEDDIKKLKDHTDKFINSTSQPKWVLLLQSLIIFESKCTKLAQKALSENF